LNEYSEIFDPFSGFSGRLIGAQNCNKKYIGQDINEMHVSESNEIIAYKNYTKAVVTLQDILTDTPHDYECLFTCPPYGGKEHWNGNNDEVEKTCDEWIDICLEKYKCKKYLFVVDKTEKYKDKIVETITNKSHFGTNEEMVILI
jgi:tRNA G10  N-methylase Trm11